jgi:hypothetical protein
MTTTVSLNYDYIIFKSVNIVPIITWGFDLTVKKNCGTTTVFNLDTYAATITDNSIQVPASVIFGADPIPDGVYNLSLACYNTNGASDFTYTEQNCIYIGTTSRCKALEFYKSITDETLKCKIELLLFALDNATLCDTCSCSKICNIYNDLLLIINSPITTTTTYVYSDCGC